jgi:hypothetical protein
MPRRKIKARRRALAIVPTANYRPWVEVMAALITAMVAFTQHPETSKGAAAAVLKVMEWIKRCIAEETGDWVPRELDM